MVQVELSFPTFGAAVAFAEREGADGGQGVRQPLPPLRAANQASTPNLTLRTSKPISQPTCHCERNRSASSHTRGASKQATEPGCERGLPDHRPGASNIIPTVSRAATAAAPIAGAHDRGAGDEDTMKATYDLSPITIATCDYDRLMFTATAARRRGDWNADFLLSELLRATLCKVDELPGRGRVHELPGDLQDRRRREPARQPAGPPEDMKWPGAELSVTTPLGIALLGLRVGDRMPYPLGDRAPEHEVLVEGVGWRFLSDMSWRDGHRW